MLFLFHSFLLNALANPLMQNNGTMTLERKR
jgi:hypothetical protein